MPTCHASMRTARATPAALLGAVLALAVLALPAYSQTTESIPRHQAAAPGQGFSLQYGYHSKYQRLGLAYETPSLWRHDFTNSGRIDLNVELGAAYWKASGNREPDSMWQVGVVPILRWWPRDTYYLEVGVGPSLLSRAHFAGKQLSTRFQFTSHIGGGILVGNAHRFGLRYTHVSNASIKTPNPGLDLIEASYTYQF